MVISDNGAVEFIVSTHKWVANYTLAAAYAINAGTDNDLGEARRSRRARERDAISPYTGCSGAPERVAGMGVVG